MKILISLFFLVTTYSGFAQTEIDKVSWLNGIWKRTNTRAGSSAEESWTKKGDQLVGYGVTKKGNDTSFVEKIQILSKDKKLFYVADVPGNKAPVYFEITSAGENGFVCENPEHDFPKKIEYKRTGNKLVATISGNGKSFDYIFEKQ